MTFFQPITKVLTEDRKVKAMSDFGTKPHSNWVMFDHHNYWSFKSRLRKGVKVGDVGHQLIGGISSNDGRK